ncbi:MAG: dihydrofolate reductase [Steroidobacteraceae bacterium]
MLSCVVAVAENGVIGSRNALPWHLPADLQRFKALTMGKPMIMGRKTWDSIGRPLPGRTSIVVSRQPQLDIAGCIVVGSLAQAIAAAGDVPEIAVIGGAELFRIALPTVAVIHLTRVHAPVPGDVFFPELISDEWSETSIERHEADARHAYAFSFLELHRT